MEYAVGDTVRLKSGGPEMTVVNVFTNEKGVLRVECAWFLGDEPKSHTFPAMALEKE